jgi:hypothetical protein
MEPSVVQEARDQIYPYIVSNVSGHDEDWSVLQVMCSRIIYVID